MKRRRLKRSGSACKISCCLSVNLYRVAEEDANAGQHPCSARRKRRRLAGAKEPVDAHIRFPDVNAGQLFCSLKLDARASGDSALSFPLCAEWLATTVHRLGVDASGKGGRVGLLSVLGFDPMSLWGLVVYLVVLFSGNPGFTAGRGFNPAGGASGAILDVFVCLSFEAKAGRWRKTSRSAFCNAADALVNCVVVAGEETSRGTSREFSSVFCVERYTSSFGVLRLVPAEGSVVRCFVLRLDTQLLVVCDVVWISWCDAVLRTSRWFAFE
ncbi:elongator complex protein 1 [Dorcoceras hygrometricum]|uniref:Elongator complex protein 1 n=1 Tax=Dorcoceras hygrometricum TaxID=472368 RepID=A0A2Z7BEC8_9LAMI|nr:elongator complex protein 1 [Dorcoceras hygrometricum]